MIYVSFTGHRPQDLPADINYQRFAAALDTLGVDKRRDIHFVVGGALGTDTWAAEYALSRSIPYSIFLPFDPEVMGARWREADRTRLHKHIAYSQTTTILSTTGRYDVAMYQRRNEAMVDHADKVFALWSGKKAGGTANCIRYALGKKPVFNLWPLDGRLRTVKEVA